MVLMAGMLPGVECARRRRIRQGAAEAPSGTSRRASLCLYTGGHYDHLHLGSSAAGSNKEVRRSSACPEGTWTTLDTNAREAKERLDQKLRSRRESTVPVKRRQSTSRATTTRSSVGGGIDTHSATATAATVAAEADDEKAPRSPTCALQPEVLASKNHGSNAGRRFIWSRLRRRPAPPSPEDQEVIVITETEECAVCLEELRAGDVLVHLPCAHRFHWACAVPWVKAASRCPVCRAQVATSPRLGS